MKVKCGLNLKGKNKMEKMEKYALEKEYKFKLAPFQCKQDIKRN
jgi:hypothetical protein